jgi:hypothetical protein
MTNEEFDGLVKEAPQPSRPSMPAYCREMVDRWLSSQPGRAGRLGEIALRVAYISCALNQDTEITVEALECALKFAEWQERIRSGYKAGLGDTLDAQCTNAVLTALEAVEPGSWVRWSDIAAKKSWYRRFSARTLSATRDALAKTGATVEEMGEDENGKPTKRTGRIRLRTEHD